MRITKKNLRLAKNQIVERIKKIGEITVSDLMVEAHRVLPDMPITEMTPQLAVSLLARRALDEAIPDNWIM